MLKKIALISSICVSHGLMAATVVELHQAPVSALNKFRLNQKTSPTSRSLSLTAEKNNLQELNQTKEDRSITTRYQQMYKGLPVVGAQVTVTNGTGHQLNAGTSGEVNGILYDEIQVNVTPALSSQQAIELAKKAYFANTTILETQDESSELQIRVGENQDLKLVYLVSFKGVQLDNKPVWPFFVIDAQTGLVTKQWNNIKTYLDSGAGGNEKVHEYWYGKDGLPALNVTQNGDQCIMETPRVKLVNLGSFWDWNDTLLNSYEYQCNNNSEEYVNGGFSPTNDAYYFGHTIVDMYQDWYGLNALQNANGTPMQLIMRVHFGQNFDNAFWDGMAMSFGDGASFYPLVSLDVAGHEVTHGFTEQHSGLEYHDQSGALNESLSDMAGQASRAYLLETNPKLYAKAYLEPNEITWGVGETIVRDSFGKALRFMDFPSSDGSSADCLDKQLAQSTGSYCAISYDELVAFAEHNIANPNDRQSYIVHTASGVFNKAFYLFSKDMGIKNAYHMMIVANTKYWTPVTDFQSGACGVLYAARDLNYNRDKVKNIFSQVGVSTVRCSL